MYPILTGQYQQGAFSPAQLVPAFNLNEDPYASYVTSILRPNGVQGATTYPDDKGLTWTGHGTTVPFIDRGSTPFPNQVASYSVSNNNAGNYLSTPSSSAFGFGTSDYTIEGWYKGISSADTYCCLYDTRASPNLGISVFAVYQSATNGGLTVNNYTTTLISTWYVSSTNQFTHWALQRKSGLLFAFLNGYLVSASSGISDSRNYGSTGPCTIGSNLSGVQQFIGWIGETRTTIGAYRYSIPATIRTLAFTPPTLPFPNP
jgi:Concanavalin A-like lectin/glucanases superfamily